MDFLNFHKLSEVSQLKAGQLLIAEPFLNDQNFARSVVLLCEYSEEGALGFILNSSTVLELRDLLPDLFFSGLSVGQGGPVQTDTLHMLHRMPEKLGGSEVCKGVYWGGAYESLKDVMGSNTIVETDLRLFVGYAGWSAGQLEDEIKSGSWLICESVPDIIFEVSPDRMWKAVVKTLGKEYAYLANLPTDPQLN